MAQFCRALLTVLTLIGWFSAASQASEPQTGVGLRLVLPGEAGGLRIVNSSIVPVRIERTIAVERQRDDGWLAMPTEFSAVAVCVKGTVGTPVVLGAGATLDVLPWRGFSCSGQCRGTCRANIYYGAGPFRYVVTTLPDRRKFPSPSFTMPARPPRLRVGGSFRIKQS